jgi:hypothetical protein
MKASMDENLKLKLFPCFKEKKGILLLQNILQFVYFKMV